MADKAWQSELLVTLKKSLLLFLVVVLLCILYEYLQNDEMLRQYATMFYGPTKVLSPKKSKKYLMEVGQGQFFMILVLACLGVMLLLVQMGLAMEAVINWHFFKEFNLKIVLTEPFNHQLEGLQIFGHGFAH